MEYEFPCFNRVETLEGLWDGTDPRYVRGVYGGVRLRSPAPTQHILPPVYVRLQVKPILGGRNIEELYCSY